jgi:hypothetical protein
LAALFWNALTWTAVVKGYDRLLQIFEERPVFLFFILFPLIGVLVVFSAIRETLVWRKFGRTVLMPAGDGNGVAGYVLMPDVVGKVSPAKLCLICFRRYSYQSSEGTETRQEAVWQDERTITPKAGGSGPRLDFRFHPPGTVPASGEHGQDSYLWELRLSMPLPGIDCNLAFELPVTASMLGGSPVVEYVGDTAAQNQEANMPAIETVAGGLRLIYPSGRSRGTALALILVSLLVSAIAIYICKNLQPFLVVTAWLMLGTTLSLTLLMLLMGLYLAFNTLCVEIGAGGLRKEMRLFGYRFSEQVAATDIVDIAVVNNGSSSIGNRTRVYYKLQLVCRNRAEMGVGDSIENYAAAQQLRQRMLQALGESSLAGPQDAPSPGEFPKLPMPVWLKKLSSLGKLLRYVFLAAAVYDIGHWLLAVNVL